MRLDADRVTVGAGAFHFEQRALAAYRAAVADSRRGPALARAVGGALRAEARFGPARWKRVPAPYPADHPRADLLRRDGLAAATTDPRPDEAFTAAFPDWCVERLRPLRPLQRWVARVIAEAG